MIVRHGGRRRWTVLDNAALDDERLGFREKGLLAYLLSRPDNWAPRAAHLADVGPDGRSAVLAAMKRLQGFGYIVRTRERGPDGRLRTVVTVHETPGGVENQPPPTSDNRHPVPPGQTGVSAGGTGGGFSDVGESDALTSTEGTSTKPKAVDESPAFDADDPPCNQDTPLAEPTPRERVAARKVEAVEITDAYWEWVKAKTGHQPPEAHQAIRKIVEAALAAGFTVSEVKRGLAAIQGRRGRRPPITRQTLWEAIGEATRGRSGDPGSADWVDAVERVNRENAAARVRAGEDATGDAR